MSLPTMPRLSSLQNVSWPLLPHSSCQSPEDLAMAGHWSLCPSILPSLPARLHFLQHLGCLIFILLSRHPLPTAAGSLGCPGLVLLVMLSPWPHVRGELMFSPALAVSYYCSLHLLAILSSEYNVHSHPDAMSKDFKSCGSLNIQQANNQDFLVPLTPPPLSFHVNSKALKYSSPQYLKI